MGCSIFFPPYRLTFILGDEGGTLNSVNVQAGFSGLKVEACRCLMEQHSLFALQSGWVGRHRGRSRSLPEGWAPTHGEWASTLQPPRNEDPEQSWGHSRERVPLWCRDRFGLGQLLTDRTEPRSTHFHLPVATVTSREFSTRTGAPPFCTSQKPEHVSHSQTECTQIS